MSENLKVKDGKVIIKDNQGNEVTFEIYEFDIIAKDWVHQIQISGKREEYLNDAL